jgi:hypothetical protein
MPELDRIELEGIDGGHMTVAPANSLGGNPAAEFTLNAPGRKIKVRLAPTDLARLVEWGTEYLKEFPPAKTVE